MKNIVLVFIDTLRADHLGCYGYPRATSPFLDELALRSLTLDACYSASNFTAPAFTSVFTATYPNQHGVFDFFTRAGRSRIKQLLDERNILTGGVVTFRFFRNLLGRIWGDLEAVTDTRSFDYSTDMPRAVSDAACEWLTRHRQRQPFCLFLHYNGPHAPYRLPPDYTDLFATVAPQDADADVITPFFPQHVDRQDAEVRDDPYLRRIHELTKQINYGKRRMDGATLQYLINSYDASIRYNDDMLARVYDCLRGQGLLENTVLAVFSDHGEEFLDHGHLGHGGAHLYEEVIRTAGIIHDPTDPRGRRLRVPVSHVQIFPTLLAMAGLAPLPPELAQLDLAAVQKRCAASGAAEPVFCTGEFKSAVRLGRYKWIAAKPSPSLSRWKRLRLWLRMYQIGEWRNELFDLATDLRERSPLAGRRKALRPVRESLRTLLASGLGAAPAVRADGDLADSERQRIEKELRDLGYM